LQTYHPIIKATPSLNRITLHTEHYSDLWYTTSNYFNYNIRLQKFTKQVNNQLIKNKQSHINNSTWEDVHDEWFIFQKHEHLTSRSFSIFFNAHQIDVPVCFSKSYSLLRASKELSIFSLITYFMRHGQRLKTQTCFLNAINYLLLNNVNYISKQTIPLTTWRTVYATLQTLYFTSRKQYTTTQAFSNHTLKNDHYLMKNAKHIQTHSSIFSALYKSLTELQPLFSFYIYKVDKKIFKNTRGKSGKFTFIWKYLAPYKRLSWVMYWLAKEIKLRPSRTLTQRLHLLLNDLLYSPEKTWVFKVKRFSYNYVYRNCRNTLAETYRTATK
jgi:hypothetical protein